LTPDFTRFCPDFHQFKTFGGAVSPPYPTQVDVNFTLKSAVISNLNHSRCC